MSVRYCLHLLWCSVLAVAFAAAPAQAQARPGTLESLMIAGADGIAPRAVHVWLPPGFDQTKRHAVLYVHDGQMLFGPEDTWNKRSWELDRTVAALLAEGAIRDVIIVAIANDPKRRHAEFFPQAALQFLEPPSLRKKFVSRALDRRPAADAYLRFLVEVVKPAVDARYPTVSSRDGTFIMGSSMGGLISLYALCEHPKIFGGAAALSTHWIGSFERNLEIPRSLSAYLERRLPPADSVRIYMDRGTEDLDALYDAAQQDVDTLMQRKGYSSSQFLSRVYSGAGHNEDAWRERSAEPLRFLLRR